MNSTVTEYEPIEAAGHAGEAGADAAETAVQLMKAIETGAAPTEKEEKDEL